MPRRTASCTVGSALGAGLSAAIAKLAKQRPILHAACTGRMALSRPAILSDGPNKTRGLPPGLFIRILECWRSREEGDTAGQKALWRAKAGLSRRATSNIKRDFSGSDRELDIFCASKRLPGVRSRACMNADEGRQDGQ